MTEKRELTLEMHVVFLQQYENEGQKLQKNKNPYLILYTPLIVQSSMRFRYIKIRCFTLAEANLHVADKETPMVHITKKFQVVQLILQILIVLSVLIENCVGETI